MMIVRFESCIPVTEKNDSIATPVTIPGSVIGKTTQKRKRDLPGKSNRSTAIAVSVPSTIAIDAAIRPIRNESRMPSRICGSFHISPYQRVV